MKKETTPQIERKHLMAIIIKAAKRLGARVSANEYRSEFNYRHARLQVGLANGHDAGAQAERYAFLSLLQAAVLCDFADRGRTGGPMQNHGFSFNGGDNLLGTITMEPSTDSDVEAEHNLASFLHIAWTINENLKDGQGRIK